MTIDGAFAAVALSRGSLQRLSASGVRHEFLAPIIASVQVRSRGFEFSWRQKGKKYGIAITPVIQVSTFSGTPTRTKSIYLYLPNWKTSTLV